MGVHDHELLAAARRLDKFYTKGEVVRDCMTFLREQVGGMELDTHDLWVEPAAGAGAFLLAMPGPRVGLDVAPEAPGVLKADFLTWSPPAGGERPIVLGNPPFGKNANLAVRFFNRSATFASRIAFIVPRTFQKASVQARLDRFFHLEAEIVLPLDAFELLGESAAVPTVFQVWVKRSVPRVVGKAAASHPDFRFVGRDEADFAVQRIGANAGRVKQDVSTIAASSHYFVKAAGDPEALRAVFAGLDFEAVKHRTAGNPSIAKPELVALYAEAIATVGGSPADRDVGEPDGGIETAAEDAASADGLPDGTRLADTARSVQAQGAPTPRRPQREPSRPRRRRGRSCRFGRERDARRRRQTGVERQKGPPADEFRRPRARAGSAPRSPVRDGGAGGRDGLRPWSRRRRPPWALGSLPHVTAPAS